MASDELTITLSDKDGHLSVETLTKALENALEWLRAVESKLVASGVEVRWEVVRATMRSPMRMTFSPRVLQNGRPNKPIGRKIINSAWQGVSAINKGSALPQSFDQEVLDATRKFVKSTDTDGMLTLESGKSKKILITSDFVRHVDALAEKSRHYMDYSTIEGRLDVVSVHGHKSFFIWETLTNRRIECMATPEAFEQALKVIGGRVAVSGRVKYRNHVPQSMIVDTPLRVLREAHELPQPKDIAPIDITNGLNSEEHVRRMRNV